MSDLPADLAFDRRSLYVTSADALVVADVHLGRDRASAVQLPLGERRDVRRRLAAALERFDPGQVVVAGDLLHSFGSLPDGVADAVATLSELAADHGADVVVTPGNHDGMLDTVFDGPTPDEYRLDDGTVVCHGHEPPATDADRYLLGHEHPALTIEGQRHPCFLYGEGALSGADVVVLPAFSRLARGVDVGGTTAADVLSPVLSRGVDGYRPVVYDEEGGEALPFPRLEGLRDHL